MSMRRVAAFLFGVLLSAPVLALDVGELWDFNDPAASEARFRAALTGATPDEALILQTQIARTYGLRRDFARAGQLLDEIATRIPGASAEAKARYFLERGRTYVSAAHSPQALTDDARLAARGMYLQALSVARRAERDDLAIDALHMLPFVETRPENQLDWNRQALDVALESRQPRARAWEASVRNNIGMTLHDAGHYDEALDEFRRALVLREQAGKTDLIRDAKWAVAWDLRALGRVDEALDIQLALEREYDALGSPDAEVYAELETLYRDKHDDARAAHYAQRKAAVATH